MRFWYAFDTFTSKDRTQFVRFKKKTTVFSLIWLKKWIIMLKKTPNSELKGSNPVILIPSKSEPCTNKKFKSRYPTFAKQQLFISIYKHESIRKNTPFNSVNDNRPGYLTSKIQIELKKKYCNAKICGLFQKRALKIIQKHEWLYV